MWSPKKITLEEFKNEVLAMLSTNLYLDICKRSKGRGENFLRLIYHYNKSKVFLMKKKTFQSQTSLDRNQLKMLVDLMPENTISIESGKPLIRFAENLNKDFEEFCEAYLFDLSEVKNGK